MADKFAMPKADMQTSNSAQRSNSANRSQTKVTEQPLSLQRKQFALLSVMTMDQNQNMHMRCEFSHFPADLFICIEAKYLLQDWSSGTGWWCS